MSSGVYDDVEAAKRQLIAGSLGEARLADLYQRHVGPATRLARLLTRNPDVAEDLAHEAFIRVAGKFGHLRSSDAFDAYLRRTVVNLCNAHFRRLRLERQWFWRQRPREDVAHSEHDPEERDAIWRALERLPYRQRAAVVLRYYEDLSVEQTGEILRCSTRAANSLLARALGSLRQSLGEEDS